MGMAKISRSSNSDVYNTKYYLSDAKSSYNWVHDATTNTIYSSTTFTSQTNIPYVSSNICYYIFDNTVSISADNEYTADDDGNGWTLSSLTAGSGEATVVSAPEPTITALTWTLYTPSVGDVMYADGAISTSYSSTYATTHGNPISIVFYTSPSTYDQNLGYTHGYAMALKSYNSGTAVDNWCASSLQSTQVTDVTYSSTTAATQWTNLTTDMDGLKHCKTAYAYIDDNSSKYSYSDLTAMYAAISGYESEVSAPSGTSGWYLPSIGQQYHWLFAFATSWSYYSTVMADYTKWTWRDTYQDFYINGNTYSEASANIASAINTYVTGKLGDSASSVWSGFAQAHYIWSSTEHDSEYPFYMNFNNQGYLYMECNYLKSTVNRQVRAVLAF